MVLSCITTLYNSADYLEIFLEKIYNSIKILNIVDFEVIIVNDGSPDNSLQKCIELKKQYKNITIIDFSKNFGHHKAFYAGLAHSKGDYVFMIDSDLEEDPSLLIEYWNALLENTEYDVVYGVQNKRKGGIFERYSGQLFYKILNSLTDFQYPVNSLTARLMKRNFVNSVLKYDEKTLELWSVFSIAGFKNLEIISTKGSKERTDYTFKKKLNLATETITASSVKPLNLIFFLGVFIFFSSLLFILWIIFSYFYYGKDSISGYSSLIASIWLIGGLTILLLGVIAIYISKIFLEVKNRPLYQIKKIL
jgi:putative glycosyltransferase